MVSKAFKGQGGNRKYEGNKREEVIRWEERGGREPEAYAQTETWVEFFWSLSPGPISKELGLVAWKQRVFMEEGTSLLPGVGSSPF